MTKNKVPHADIVGCMLFVPRLLNIVLEESGTNIGQSTTGISCVNVAACRSGPQNNACSRATKQFTGKCIAFSSFMTVVSAEANGFLISS